MSCNCGWMHLQSFKSVRTSIWKVTKDILIMSDKCLETCFTTFSEFIVTVKFSAERFHFSLHAWIKQTLNFESFLLCSNYRLAEGDYQQWHFNELPCFVAVTQQVRFRNRLPVKGDRVISALKHKNSQTQKSYTHWNKDRRKGRNYGGERIHLIKETVDILYQGPRTQTGRSPPRRCADTKPGSWQCCHERKRNLGRRLSCM